VGNFIDLLNACHSSIGWAQGGIAMLANVKIF
jgi:hypothetical protein